MPYVKQDVRELLDGGYQPQNVGELNYVITGLCNRYVDTFDASYKIYNDIIGVLECAKQEFYRRAVSPYEDNKIKENGDVY